MLSTASQATFLLLLGRLQPDCALYGLPRFIVRELVELLWPALPSHHVVARDPDGQLGLFPARLRLPRAPLDEPWRAPLAPPLGGAWRAPPPGPLDGSVDAELVGDTAGAFTVEAWVQIDAFTRRGALNPIVVRHELHSGWALYTRKVGPEGVYVVCMMVTVEPWNGYGPIETEPEPDAVALPRGRWVHVAGVWDGDQTVRAYQSGELVGETVIVGPPGPVELILPPPKEPLCAAYNRNPHYTPPLQGRVAELCVTPEALSPTTFRLL